MAKKSEPRVTGAQLRAARVLLGVTIADLAEKTGLGERTIKRAVQEDSEIRLTAANQKLLVSALEELGVEFIPANGGGVGVRLGSNRAQKPTRSAPLPSHEASRRKR